MKLSKLEPNDAAALALQTLGLDNEVADLTSPEGLAASLRRAASFMCPTSPDRIVDAVLGAVGPVVPGSVPSRDDVTALLGLLTASGDLLELRQEGGRSTRLLYLGPPSYIEREPGTFLLIGIRPFGAPLFHDDLVADVEYEAHTRLLRLDAETVAARLEALGLHPVSREAWVASPRVEHPQSLLDRAGSRLNVAGAAGEIDGLTVLNPAAPTRYYKGRWRPPSPSDTGDFVARRPQAYGADLWCFVRLKAGTPQRLIDLPIDDPVVPGRDEAWRLQSAIDAIARRPQRYRISSGHGRSSDAVVEFFSPLPGFAERYLQLVGHAVGRTPGALLSFRVPPGAMPDVATFLTDMLWMEPAPEENRGEN